MRVRKIGTFIGGLIRLHILHHASKGPVFGLWFIEEFGRHGYKLSPGTLYPLLHGLERKGYLRSIKERWVRVCAGCIRQLRWGKKHC